MNPLVSIIVPCYNLEEEIQSCLDSILQQTYKSIEVIVIDDGSSDNTLKVCEKYKRKDDRIILLAQENQGVSLSRNKGLEIARGEYICFVDGDDVVDEAYIALMLNNLLKYNADVSAVSYTKNMNQLGAGKENVISLWNRKETLIHYVLEEKFFPGPVCKLFKRAVIKDLEFDGKLRIAEDKLFVFQAIEKCAKIVFQEAYLYFYLQRPSSAMHANFDEKFLDSKYVTDLLCERWNSDYPELKNLFEAEKIFSYARRIQDSIRDNSEVSKKIRRIFLSEVRKCNLRTIAPYLSKKKLCLLCMEKYCLPLLFSFEKIKCRWGESNI